MGRSGKKLGTGDKKTSFKWSIHTKRDKPVVLERVAVDLVVSHGGHVRHARRKTLDALHECITVEPAVVTHVVCKVP
jgi:hypothetical protein